MFYNNRPRIKVIKTRTDNIIEIIGWCILVALWCTVFIYYPRMPNTIPIHYNHSGEIDGYGDKSMIWIVLIIGSVMYIGLKLVSRYPHIFNYPSKITEENALNYYTNATKMFRYLNLIIILIFGYIVFDIAII